MKTKSGEDTPKRQPSFYRSPSNDYEEGYRDGTKDIASLREQLKQKEDDLFVERQLVKVKQKEKEMMAIKLKQKEDESRELKQAIKKYIFHWDKFFGDPIVGQPPSQEDLRKLIKDK